MYSVINRRNGKVVEAVGMDTNERVFLVKAELPVISSIGFATEIRKATSGQAMPNLKFDRYEVSFSLFLTFWRHSKIRRIKKVYLITSLLSSSDNTGFALTRNHLKSK